MKNLTTKIKQLSLSAVAALVVADTYAADFSVEVENLTRGAYFTPLAIAAHPDGTSLFELGAPASAEVQAIAEGGDISSAGTLLTSLGATQANNPAAGLLAPGASTTASLNTDGTANVLLSVLAMILPTNDGFVALNSIEIPTEPGVYTYYARAYDAGTEANDEIRGSGASGMPGFPVPGPIDSLIGTGGTGITATAEGFIHVHRGVLGDTNSTGGNSDIDSTLHRWLNPVAKITVTVTE